LIVPKFQKSFDAVSTSAYSGTNDWLITNYNLSGNDLVIKAVKESKVKIGILFVKIEAPENILKA